MNQRGGQRGGARAAATFYADRAQLQAWFDGAGPGHSAVYATGPAIEPQNETVRTVIGWRDAGLVVCHLGRGGDGGLRYQIRKSAAAVAASTAEQAGKRARPLPDIATDEGELGRAYRLIARAAQLGRPCPTNGEIAEALELGTRFHGRRLFDRLVAAGHLRVSERLRFGARVVEIAASGLRTTLRQAQGNRENES